MDLKHGLPLSLIKNGLPYEYPKLEQDLVTDVLIIGSGVSGALSASELVKAGFGCTIVDERSIALGSTCASTSLLQYELDTPLHKLKQQIGNYNANRAYIMCSDAIDRAGHICKQIGYPDLLKAPSLYYAAYKKHAKLIEEEYAARLQAGFKLELLNSSEIMKLFGFSAPNALLSQQGASIDAYAFTHALHQHSIKKGLQVYQRTGIAQLEYRKRDVVATTHSGQKIRARKIVNATGYEVTSFIGKDLVSLHSTYAVASEQLSGDMPAWNKDALIWNTADPYLYLRKTKDNRIIIGGRDEEFYSPEKRDKLLRKKSAQLVDDCNRLFPQHTFNPEFCWTGTFGVTSDSLPYIGTYHKTPHTYYALGFGGNGITFSIIAAQLIADMMTGKKNPDAKIYAFDR